MEAESSDTIVGINAPVDLSGRTPLAWSVRSRARNKQVCVFFFSSVFVFVFVLIEIES